LVQNRALACLGSADEGRTDILLFTPAGAPD